MLHEEVKKLAEMVCELAQYQEKLWARINNGLEHEIVVHRYPPRTRFRIAADWTWRILMTAAVGWIVWRIARG